MRKDRKRLGKAAAGSPAWLRAVQISKRPRRAPIKGTFGPASDVRHIDPATLRLAEEEQD